MSSDALATVLPSVAERVPRVCLGQWPTPIEVLDVPNLNGIHYVKREDLSAADYGGNKIRCLEPVFAQAVERGVEKVWATGAYGSNQAVAIAIHAEKAGLDSGAILFPQPSTETARANLRALASTKCEIRLLRTILSFPFALAQKHLLSSKKEMLIPPGAAVPLGAIGHISAALEVAEAVAQGSIEAPAHVVLPVGSTCTSAGLLVGFALSNHLGLGFVNGPPTIHSVRISPWPVTARFRIVSLAVRTAALVRSLGGPDLIEAVKQPGRLQLSGGLLGGGYGTPTTAGVKAKSSFEKGVAPVLDTTYSAKAAAHLFGGFQPRGPILFWSTKSSAPLPVPKELDLKRLTPSGTRWLSRSHRLDP